MKKVLILAIAVVLIVAIGVTKFNWFQSEKKEEMKEVTFNLEQEPGTLDPQLLTDSIAIQANNLLMEGLTRLDETGQVTPGMAESWEVDGSTWTFKIRDAQWSNGEPVTAHDFEFGIKRAINPETASQYAYMTYYIKGAQKFNEGEITDWDKVGITAEDDKTLVIELEKPAAYFASVTAFPTYLPLNEEFYEKTGMEYALEKETLLFNGPFVLSDWEHDSEMVFMKNENYWNKDDIKLDKINGLMVNDSNTALNMYKNDELDIVALSGEQLPEYKDSPQLNTYPDGSVWYWQFNMDGKLLSNKKIRKALTIAIDREKFVKDVRKDGSVAAEGLVPFGFPGVDEGFRKDFGSIYEDVNLGDSDYAKQLLEEGLEEIGHTGPVEFSYLTGTSNSATRDAQFFQEELRTKLGVNLKIEQVTFQIRLQRQRDKDFQIVGSGWGPDYNDPMTYMDLFTTWSGNNDTGWSNEEYDNYIKTAYSSTDNEERMKAMAAAEEILAEEYPISITFYRMRNRLVKPNVKGYTFRAVGAEQDLVNAYVVEEEEE